jgi:hypothetical protein
VTLIEPSRFNLWYILGGVIEIPGRFEQERQLHGTLEGL